MNEGGIRAATEGDIGGVLDLWRRSEATPTSSDTPEDLLALIRGWPGALLVAEAEGRIVGSIIWGFDGWRGTLYRLAVDPSQRRRGLGRALVRAAEERLRAAGCRRVFGLVESDHPLAVAFWQASDYARVARIDPYFKMLAPAADPPASEEPRPGPP